MSPFDAESKYAKVTGYELLLDLSMILLEVKIGVNLFKEMNGLVGTEM